MTAHEYIILHGEEYRTLIVDALKFLDKHEPSWGLETPINREQFIEELIARTIA